jgi:cellulose biosynthesis protein BcsQ
MPVVTIAGTRPACGKTATAVNLAAELTAAGLRVSLLDLDPAAAATRALGVAPIAHPWDTPARAVPVAGAGAAPLLLRAGGPGLAGARGTDVHALLEQAADQADWLVVDTPTGAGTLTTAAAETADLLLVPVEPDGGGAEELRTLTQLGMLLDASAPELRALLVRVAPDRADPEPLRAQIRAAHPGALLRSEVPLDDAVGESASAALPLRLFAPRAPAALAYHALAVELLGDPRAAGRT